MMEPSVLMELLWVASGAKTDEEKARVAWRASDWMWRVWMEKDIPLGYCRAFNNLCQDEDWPWVKDLWSEEEVAEVKAKWAKLGLPVG